jgi:type VI protein secretion system component Hcp
MERESQHESGPDPAAAQVRPVPVPVPATVADRVVQLQRSIGNRQTTRVLARDETKEQKTTSRVEIGDLLVDVESFQFALQGRSGGTQGGGSVTEAHFSSFQGEHSHALFKLALDGAPATARLTLGRGDARYEYTFKGALVSSYSISGAGGTGKPMESWSINFTSMEQKQK